MFSIFDVRHGLLRASLLLGFCAALGAQETATLSGTVFDPSEAVVPATEVTLNGAAHGIVRQTKSDAAGVFSFDSLPPGEYTLDINKVGFKKMRLEHVQLNMRDRQSLRIDLRISAAASTSVDVSDAATISTDISTGAAIEHDYSQNLPVNGRDVQSLIRMSPGVVSAGSAGEVNANGLRSNTNYYTIDGVSANRSMGMGGGGGGGFGGRGGGGPGGMGGGGSMGAGPGGMGGGSIDGMSLDSLQEVRVQTSTFAPEFGRSPGAQISMMSRGGSNRFHGSASEYFRNDKLNANDWFANSTSYPRAEMRQNRFGAALGGPVRQQPDILFRLLRRAPPEVAANRARLGSGFENTPIRTRGLTRLHECVSAAQWPGSR